MDPDNVTREPGDAEAAHYAKRESLPPGRLAASLRKLEMLHADLFMRVQASHLDIVDQFLLDVEAAVLRKLIEDERTPPEAHFLAAQSQMWIFAAYELLRTWTERAKAFIKLADNGGFPNKLASLRAVDDGYEHFGRQVRIRQLEAAAADPAIIDRLRHQVALLYMPFKMLEHLRVAIAKHEVSGKAKGIALFPGHGRINMWCGSLDYELENGRFALCTRSRRDIADSLRFLELGAEPPDAEAVESFNRWLSGQDFDPQQVDPGAA
jgi:hypothetical protein